MLRSHTPLRRAERTISSRSSYYLLRVVLLDVVNGSSTRSVSSRRLHDDDLRSPRVVAHRNAPVLIAA